MKRLLFKGNRNLINTPKYKFVGENINNEFPSFNQYKNFYEHDHKEMFGNMIFSEAEPSTQTFMKDFIKKEINGYCNSIYITNNQTAGKGRLANKWVADTSTL
jgi:hypothetical protein